MLKTDNINQVTPVPIYISYNDDDSSKELENYINK